MLGAQDAGGDATFEKRLSLSLCLSLSLSSLIHSHSWWLIVLCPSKLLDKFDTTITIQWSHELWVEGWVFRQPWKWKPPQVKSNLLLNHVNSTDLCLLFLVRLLFYFDICHILNPFQETHPNQSCLFNVRDEHS